MKNKWISIKDKLPEYGEEVLVECDGHRGPSWRNNYNLVAYRGTSGGFFEERHRSENPLPVIYWMKLPNAP